MITYEDFKKFEFPKNIIAHCTIDPSWGACIYVMYICNGIAVGYGRLYWLNDDKYSVYLEGLHVDDEYRGNGIGLFIQEIREVLGNYFEAKQVFLWVKKGSWMEAWYKRRGYRFYIEHKEEPDSVWMVKQLINQ